VVCLGCPPGFPDWLQYFCIDVKDTPESILVQAVVDASAFIHQNVQEGAAVLVHCVYGQSRSVTGVPLFVSLALISYVSPQL
jgi:predicted protein tyrosine phosphatase